MRYVSVAFTQWCALVGLLLMTCLAQASTPSAFTYQGRMYNQAGTEPLTEDVYFVFTVTSPDGTCVLYEETSAVVSLSATEGLFAVQVGAGTPTATAGVNTFSSLSHVFSHAHPGPRQLRAGDGQPLRLALHGL
jgi:hypothetical protein